MTTAFENPSDAEMTDLLRRVRTIAVIGLSPNPSRPSHGVARAMQAFGYRIIPVRPGIECVLGEKAYSDLADIPGNIDLVDVFRRPEEVDAIVDRVTARRLPALWLQEGVVNETAALRARVANVTVVMNRCVYREYLRLFGARSRTDVFGP